MQRLRITFAIMTLGLLLAHMASAQEVNDYSPREHAERLSNGILLVRLHTKSVNIQALEQAGKVKQAAQLAEKQRQRNLELTQAVKEFYTFSKVSFFYSQDSPKIVAQNYESVDFVDADLNADNSVSIGDMPVYTAELALIAQDVSQKQRNITLSEERNPSDTQNEAVYYGGANMRFHAFIIKDSTFNQLRRPFPYYSRTLNSFFMKRRLSEVVRIMNEKLQKFYMK